MYEEIKHFVKGPFLPLSPFIHISGTEWINCTLLHLLENLCRNITVLARKNCRKLFWHFRINYQTPSVFTQNNERVDCASLVLNRAERRVVLFKGCLSVVFLWKLLDWYPMITTATTDNARYRVPS